MAAPTLVQSAGTATGSGPHTISVTLGSAPTSGNTLVAVVSRSYGDVSNDISLDGTWTELSEEPVDWSAYGIARLYTRSATGASATTTATQGGSYDGSRLTLAVYEVDASIYDWALNDTSSSLATTHALASVTPANGDDVGLLAVAINGHGQALSSGPSSYSTAVNVQANSGGASNRHVGFYRQVTGASGSYGGTVTWSTVTHTASYHIIFAAASTPIAEFSATPNPASVGGTVTFTDLSTGTPTSWSWDFGDGDTSTDQNPTHAYAAEGVYTVTLTATNAAGSDTETKFQFIVVNASPAPGFWMDWLGDGFDSGSGAFDDPRLARGLPQAAALGTAASDNITAYVMRAEWWRGGSYDHVGANGPGGFTLVLDNSDGRFDPENTASPYYGHMTPGRPVWAGAIATDGSLSGSGSVAGFLAGYVREFVPTVDASGHRVCEVIGEDVFGRWQAFPVSVSPSLSRSHADFRDDILDALGEDTTRRNLDTETGMLPFSAVESTNGLDVLEELNRATATRHYIQPADTKEDWYDYTTVNKLHKLQSASDATLTGDDIHEVSGWRVTNDNVIECQRATVEPITLTADNATVWQYEDVPVVVTQTKFLTVIADFDDYVFDADIDYNTSTGTLAYDFTAYGKRAYLNLYAATGTPVTIGSLRILGRQVVRGDTIQVASGDQTTGAKNGAVIASDYIGQTGAARGLCDFIVWKYGQPLKRPNITVKAKNATTFSFVFERDLYDVVTLSIDRLSVTSRRLEIVGLRGSVVPGRDWTVVYELQETPNQSALDWFDVDTDLVNGALLIAPF